MSKAEKFIQEHTRKLTQYGDDYFLWITPDQARKAVETAKEEIYEWLRKNAHKYSNIGIYTDAMITDLKQAMKHETQNL